VCKAIKSQFPSSAFGIIFQAKIHFFILANDGADKRQAFNNLLQEMWKQSSGEKLRIGADLHYIIHCLGIQYAAIQEEQ